MDVALGQVADRYEIGEIVGQGRSSVYRARDTRLGRDVALKRVLVAPGVDDPASSSESPEDVRTRALREARATARVASPHAVGVYDVVEEGDAVWLVMELVAAPSLERLVVEQGPLDEARAARIGLDVLDALAAAHAEGIVHRDVKPANVLVGTPVKLADFGIAALRDESGLTQPGMVVGSPSYMAPEQASAGEVSAAADLWALGALLYFAVEGVPPFASGSALATATAVVHSPFRPQRRPGRLSPVIARLLAKDPRVRPGATSTRRLLAPIAAGADPSTGPLPLLATTTFSRAAAPGPEGGDATLTRPAAVPPSGRGRRRLRRLALAAVLAVVLAGTAAAAELVSSGGHPSDPPVDAGIPSSPAAGAPALVPAAGVGADRGTGGPATTTPTTAVPAAPAPGKAKGKGKDKGPAHEAAASDPAATVATPATPPTTVAEPPTTESAPPDPVVTEPPPTTEAPPTTLAAVGGHPATS